jgi:lysophospholipase L1-like esterase
MHKFKGSQLAKLAIIGISFTPAMYGQQVASADIPTLTTPASDPLLTKPVEELSPAQIASMQKKLADWPNLARYHDDDIALGDPRPAEARVVFFGDSITDGWGRGHGKFFPDQPWVNRGISGQTTPQMLLRFQQDVLALHPRAVVILAGINDIAGNTGPESFATIQDNFRSMVSLAKAARVNVVLCSVLPAARFPWHPGIDPRAEVVKLNGWLQQFATEEQLLFLDYYPAMVAPDGGMNPELSKDGVHPNDAGYAVMEPLARAAVAKALAQHKH